MLESIEGALPGKRMALFGSYGWGDGEWIRTWETRCTEKSISLVTESVLAEDGHVLMNIPMQRFIRQK